MHGNTPFDVSTTKISPHLLADIGNEEENKVEKSLTFHPIAPTIPLQSTITKFDKVGGTGEVINHIKFGVDQLIDADVAGS